MVCIREHPNALTVLLDVQDVQVPINALNVVQDLTCLQVHAEKIVQIVHLLLVGYAILVLVLVSHVLVVVRHVLVVFLPMCTLMGSVWVIVQQEHSLQMVVAWYVLPPA